MFSANQCTWEGPVDIGGLDPKDQARIRKIGLKAWLAEKEKPCGRDKEPKRKKR